MHDDYVFLRPIRAEDIHHYHIGRISETIGPREPKNGWHYTMLKTEYILEQYGLEAYNYDGAHCPVKLHKDLFPLIFKKWEKYWASDIGVGFKTLFVCSLPRIEHHKIMPFLKMEIEKPDCSISKINKEMKKHKLMSHGPGALKLRIQK